MRSIAGCRILVTRTEEDSRDWAQRLTHLGARPIVFPCLTWEPIGDAATAARLRAAVADADWLVLASARGAERVAHLIGGPLPEGVRLAAVGPATARSASEHLGPVALVAEGATSEALARELVELVRRERPGRSARAVVAGAAGGRADAELILRDAGLAVRRVDVYRTVPAPPDECKRDLAAEGVEVVLLASPSAVTGLVNRALLPAAARVVTIGPTTSAAAQAAGLRVSAEAGRPNLDGMLEALS